MTDHFRYGFQRPTAAQVSGDESERLVNAFIAKKGVTKCPTAFVAPSRNAQPDPADMVRTMEAKVPRGTIRKRNAHMLQQDSFWTPALMARIVEMRGKKIPYAEIGREIGRSASSVNNAVYRFNNKLFPWQAG